MNWSSFSEFVHMNGHGYYVWMSYGALICAVVYELWSLVSRRRRICARLSREARATKSTLEI